GDDVLLASPAGPRRLPPGALRALAMLIEAEPQVDLPEDLPFAGGALGYLGFELGREVERLPATTRDDVGAPDLAFGWYDAALVRDELAGKAWLVGRPEAVDALRARLREGELHASEDAEAGSAGVLRSNVTRPQYLDA